MVKTSWWDMDVRGRDIAKICKQAKTNYFKYENLGNHELAESYFRRWSIAEKLIQPYVQDVTAIRRIINKAEKKNPELKVV